MLGVSMRIGRETLRRLTRGLLSLCQGAVRSPLRSGVKINQPLCISTNSIPWWRSHPTSQRPWLAGEAIWMARKSMHAHFLEMETSAKNELATVARSVVYKAERPVDAEFNICVFLFCVASQPRIRHGVVSKYVNTRGWRRFTAPQQGSSVG